MNTNNHISAIGVDIGGTKMLAGKIVEGRMVRRHKVAVPAAGSETDVLAALYQTIDGVIDNSVSGIGIGVPSVVDVEEGIVYDVQNIPSWKEVHLKTQLEKRYQLPVFLNNDANCFAIGEKHFGKGQGYKDVMGLILGTGMAAGIIINDKLYSGHNCGAGEFGMIQYLDHHYEYYCSGQFFEHVHQTDGATAFRKASDGDREALSMFEEYGAHLGRAMNTILYAYDPEIIILGGSVSKAYHFYKKTLWEGINQLVYRKIAERIKIEVSDEADIAVLGAAALYYERLPTMSH